MDAIKLFLLERKIVNKENLSAILIELINLISKIDKDFICKKEIWDKYGIKISENPEAFEDYKKPILLVLNF